MYTFLGYALQSLGFQRWSVMQDRNDEVDHTASLEDDSLGQFCSRVPCERY